MTNTTPHGQVPEALQPDTALLVARNCRETGSDPSCPFFARVQLMDAAYVLERLHAENATLQSGYDAARLGIEALRSRQCLHQIAEPAGERTAKDSAIEHAEYMAQNAERLLSAINTLNAQRDEDETAFDEAELAQAEEAVSEAFRAMRSGIYEFRKRRDRAMREQAAPAAVAGASDDRIRECAARLVAHADFRLGGTLSADSKARDIPSKACSQVKSRHLAALRDALAAAPTPAAQPAQTSYDKRLQEVSAAQHGATAQPVTEPAKADSVQEDALSDAVRVPLDSLHADAAYLIGRLRDGSMPYVRVIEIIHERIDAAKAAIRARASHGQAPAAVQVGSVPKAQFDDPKVQAVYAILCEDAEPPKGEHWEGFAARRIVDALLEDSVLEDAARLDFLIDQRAYVVSDPDACPGHWLHWSMPDGSTWVQGDEHPTPRAAIDAARKQGVTK